jgi:hypothetical protein
MDNKREKGCALQRDILLQDDLALLQSDLASAAVKRSCAGEL